MPRYSPQPSLKCLRATPADYRVFRTRSPHCGITYIWCNGVQWLAEDLRRGRGRDPLNQHKKILPFLNLVLFQGRGEPEVIQRGARVLRLDLILNGVNYQLRTTTRVESDRVLRLVVRHNLPALGETYDHLLVAFFYHVPQQEAQKVNYAGCPYALTVIDFARDEVSTIPAKDVAEEVVSANARAKRDAAVQMGIPDEILIPCPNLILTTDMEREIAQKDQALAQKDQALAQKDQALAQKEAEIERLKGELARATGGKKEPSRKQPVPK